MDSASQDYVERLESTLAAFLSPLKNLPFDVVIKAITGYSVVPFNKESEADAALLGRLSEALQDAVTEANRVGIFTDRPNEVGNHIEPFVRDALVRVGCKAAIPTTKYGKHKASGYPDIEIKDVDDRVSYLECKTYSIKSEESSFRAFYLQPSEDNKITADARHLLVGFEVKSQRRGTRMVYVPTRWRLYTLERLRVQVKHEFNASNLDIYREDSILAEGRVRSS